MGMCDVRDKLLVVGFVVAINFLMYVVGRMIYKAPVVVSTLNTDFRMAHPRKEKCHRGSLLARESHQ